MKWFCSADGFRATLCLICLLAFNGSVKPKPLPEGGGTVTQTGEPSHFQVDDKAAEIEVNANPAGVKVNAKPASLQVVAKPGAPAVPIFHPAIHLAQHYAPPPVIHHSAAMFYHDGFHYPFGHDWFYNGIKRHKFPSPRKDQIQVRTHKSDIPRSKHHKKASKSNKRQFISAAPQFAQPSPLAAFGGLSALGIYGYGASPQYGSLVGAPLGVYGLRQNPQTGLLSSSPQLAPQQGLQESGISRSLLPSESTSTGTDTTDILRRYQRLYGELNALANMYNSLVRQRSLHSLQDVGYAGGMGVGGALRMNTDGSDPRLGQLGFGAPRGPVMGYTRTYIPSPLVKLYGTQASLPQTNRFLGVPGASLVGQPPMARYLDLSSLLQGSPSMVSRSKVPAAPDKEDKKHDHQDDTKKKAKVKRQALVEPILTTEDPDSVDDLFQGGYDQDYKRQMILTPALETLQQLQPLQPLYTRQAIQPQSLQLRQLQLQPQILPEQSLTRQSLALQGTGMQPTGMQQQIGIPGTQQLGLLPLTSTPLRYMTPSLVTPLESVGSSFDGRSSAAAAALPQSFASQSLVSPLISGAFTRPGSDYGSLQDLSSSSLFQDRSQFRRPLRLGFPGYPRRLFHRPQYRRRLHNFREEDNMDGIQPEVLGRERISQEGSYSSEIVPSSQGETLINSPVGFGPITVEAKTAEGARRAAMAGEDKRHRIHRPVERKPKGKRNHQ